MSNTELTTACTELQELRRLREELEAEIEAITDRLKAYMEQTGAETLTAGAFKLTYKTVTSTRIDTAALRKDLPEVWQEYGKTSTVRRFTVA